MGNITQKWEKLLAPFTSGYSQRFSQSELSRLSGIPQQTASRHLNSLMKKGLISYEIQGRNKLFYIDLLSNTADTLLLAIENHKALEFHQKSKEVSVLINELLACSESVILFGSYASLRSSRDSDIDIMIAGRAEKDRIKSIKQRYPLQINEHYVSYKELADSIRAKNPLAIEIMKNHVLFGDISKIIRILKRAAI